MDKLISTAVAVIAKVCDSVARFLSNIGNNK